MKIIYLLVFLSSAINPTFSANILCILPLPLYSHTSNYLPIFKELAARGHNVTVVSPFPQKTPVPNLTDIVVPDVTDKMIGPPDKRLNFVELDGIIFDLVGLWIFASGTPQLISELEPIQNLMKDQHSKYDLVIVETWFVQEVLVAFGHKFNAPVINVAATSINPLAAYLTGNLLPASYVPVPKLPYSDHMSFTQRLWNAFCTFWDIPMGTLHLMYQDYLMRKYIKYPGSENLPPLIDMLRNTSLTLMDSNFAVNYPTPYHKNIVEFGGIKLKKAPKLPADIQKIMDNEKEGVIYFTFGSHLNVSNIDPEKQKVLINVFGKLKHKVFMKLESTNPFLDLAKSKKNLLIQTWFPQPSILAHPNCKLFITHGGLHGVMEGVYHAVPMLAIPLIADQKFNAKFIENSGIGEVIQLKDLNEANLLNSIDRILKNPSYRERVKERSVIFKDTPISIMDNAIYWIEYVIRHKGAPHLRPAVVDLYWYQSLMIDVILFYAIILITILYVMKLIIIIPCKLLKYLFKRKDKNQKKKKE